MKKHNQIILEKLTELNSILDSTIEFRQMTQEEIDAIVDEAHAFHKIAAVHCFTPNGQDMALKAGATTTGFVNCSSTHTLTSTAAARDVLVVDLPPGTGDAQLTLAQAVPMAGVVVVTTPQQVSLADARRGLAMFLQMGVPVLGVVENMSVFIPPDAPEKRYAIFGSGGGATLAAEAGVPLLAELPLELPVREGGDSGRPVVLSACESATAQAFIALADRLNALQPVPA
jgi:MinD-like ATPase involved in chromosome partitioning or flagellar assembly